MSSRERSEHQQRRASGDDQSGESRPLSDALARLEGAVSAIHDSEAFRAYLDTQARFHRYSWGNVLLILSQRPDASQVAGFQRWRELGRHVRRGEHGIKILVPMRVRTRPSGESADDRPRSPGQEEEPSPLSHRLLFKVGTVFDVSLLVPG